MGNNTQATVSGLPRMLTTERAPAVTSVPLLPSMSPEFAHGGEWMDPQWKKNLRGYKGMFGSYPIQMALILVLTIGLAIGLAFTSKACAGSGTSGGDSNSAIGQDGGNLVIGQTSAQIDSLEVSVISTRLVDSSLGETGIEVILNATNTSGDAVTPYSELFYDVTQAGNYVSELSLSCAEYSYGSSQTDEMQAGENRNIFFFFSPVVPDGGVVNLTISNLTGDSTLDFTFDPQASGTSEPVTDPTDESGNDGSEGGDQGGDTVYYSDEVAGALVNLTDYALIDNIYGAPAMLVELTVTNNGDTDSPFFLFNYYAYQNDEELSESTSSYPDYHATITEPLATGETRKVYFVFHGVDPSAGDVLFYLEDYMNEDDNMSVMLLLE